jgi:Xaa-Pro aminopeptidase
VVADFRGRGLADPDRLARIGQGMDREGLEAIVAWRPEELVVCTGAPPHLGMTLALISRDGRAVAYRPPNEPDELIGPGLADHRFLPGRGSVAWSDLGRRLREDVTRFGLAGRPIGLAEEGPRSSPAGNAAEGSPLTTPLVRSLVEDAGGAARDARTLFDLLMLRKTDREVEALRRAHAVASRGLRAFHDGLSAGPTEAELAAMVEAAVAGQTGRGGCMLARAWASVQAGPNSSLGGTFSRSSGRPLQRGELALLEVGVVVDGMWCDLARTASVGPASPEQAELLANVRQAQAVAARAAVPGASHAAVDAAARRELAERGVADAFQHATGHHVGFRYHDPGPILAAGAHEPLEQGMVVAIEPGAYGPQLGGARFEDNFLITASGAAALSDPSLVAA